MSRKYVQKPARVPVEDARWFEEHYPQRGAWTWFVQSCLTEFKDLHEEVPDDLIAQAVAEVMHQENSRPEEN